MGGFVCRTRPNEYLVAFTAFLPPLAPNFQIPHIPNTSPSNSHMDEEVPHGRIEVIPDPASSASQNMTVEPSLDTAYPSPSSSPQAPLQEGLALASQPLVPVTEAGRSKHSVFEGAHDFQIGAFNHNYLDLSNASHVNIHVRHSWRHFLGDLRVWLLAILPLALLVPMLGIHHHRTHMHTHNIGELVALPKHPDMSGKPVGYLADSRKLDVEESREWISNSTDLVLSIHGPAGIGKSTLAGHLSDELRSVGRLAASIFLGAFPTDTSGPETIIKMLAHELGSIHPRAILKIVEAMNRCHGTSLETHIEGYILEPLRSLGHPHPLIIILDAIDEWRDHPTFIRALTHLNSESAVVKFIITSRLNRLPGIDKISVRRHPLLPISTKVMENYFEKHLETVPWVDGWKASPADVIKLAELSAGLPVWASTVISLLSQPFSESPPHEILAGILASERDVGGSQGLAELYSSALTRLFPSSDAQKHFRTYFGMTLVLLQPLPLSDFSTLTGVPSHLIGKIQLALSALQTRSPPPGSERMVHPATTLFHLSFMEYVQASETGNSFAISPFDSHSALGLACLKQITTLPSVPPSQDPSSVLRDSQRYAIMYWPFHVSGGTHRSGVEWSQTPHWSTLQTISTDTRQRWATLFFKILWPELAGSWEESRVHTVLKDAEAAMSSILEKLAFPLYKFEASADQWGFQVTCLEVAVRLDSGNAGAWLRLGSFYQSMGNAIGSLKMYEEAVVVFRSALRALEQGPNPDLLDSLAIALVSCYREDGNITTLTEAISYQRKALALWPTPHPPLGNLPVALNYLYRNHGDISALNECILLLREALALRPAPLPGRHGLLTNLGCALQGLFEHSGNLSAVNEAISYLREALTLQRPSSPGPHTCLGATLQFLYERGNGGIDALNEGISHHREALALRPAPSPDQPMLLHNLGSSLLVLYDYNGNIDVLNEGISHLREGLALRPAPHSKRIAPLYALGFALSKLYDHNGNIDTLNECISHLREVLTLQPATHPEQLVPFQSLGTALPKLYGHNGNIDALKEGISHLCETLALQPSSYPHRQQGLTSLSNALWSQFKQNREIEIGMLEPDEVIIIYGERLTPGHGDRAHTGVGWLD